MQKITSTILLFSLAFLLTSCTSRRSAVLQDTTCDAPCWRNIEIGKTDVQQTIELLNRMPDVEHNSIQQGKKIHTPNMEVVEASFLNSKESHLEVTFVEEKASGITFNYSKNISLADAIKKYGEPKIVILYAIQGDPAVYLIVDFLYPDAGICLHHQYQGLSVKIPKSYKLKGSLNIANIYYVDPSIPDGQVTYGCLTGSDEIQLDPNKQNWNGFVEYPVP